MEKKWPKLVFLFLKRSLKGKELAKEVLKKANAQGERIQLALNLANEELTSYKNYSRTFLENPLLALPSASIEGDKRLQDKNDMLQQEIAMEKLQREHLLKCLWTKRRNFRERSLKIERHGST